MPRMLRIQYPNARYHIINRGNYRSDVFDCTGAPEAFLRAMWECAARFEWKVHAYVLMRNHYHLSIETPRPNLSGGMHWLQGTFASRFNRLRKQSGRLFQGPYKAQLIEDLNSLCRVVDYIHLNPVRAGVVAPAHVEQYRWSSLHLLNQGGKASDLDGLAVSEWLKIRGGAKDGPKSIRAYVELLRLLGNNEAEQREKGLIKLSRGWAIGTHGWKQALAREYVQHRPIGGGGLCMDELEEIRKAKNEDLLEQELKRAGKIRADLQTRPRAQIWKLEIALSLRDAGVPIAWLAQELHLGKSSSVRSVLSRRRTHAKQKNQQ